MTQQAMSTWSAFSGQDNQILETFFRYLSFDFSLTIDLLLSTEIWFTDIKPISTSVNYQSVKQ